jgi:hypothetical protein
VTWIRLSTELVSMEILNRMIIGKFSKFPLPFGEKSMMRGRMKVLKFQENISVIGAFTLDNIPAGRVMVYVVSSVKLA